MNINKDGNKEKDYADLAAEALAKSDRLDHVHGVHGAAVIIREKIAPLVEELARLSKVPQDYEKELDDAMTEAERWKAQGDMFGWNFHKGRESGIISGNIISYASIQAAESRAQKAETQVKVLREALEEISRDEKWKYMESAPKDGTVIEGLYQDGPCLIRWAETRQCMLAGVGGGNGYFGPGWEDDYNHLIMDAPMAWRLEEENLAQEALINTQPIQP